VTAASEYTKWGDGDGTLGPSDVALGFRLADAAIAEMEAENERLKCCGNCGCWALDHACGADPDGLLIPDFAPWDRCHFLDLGESRWTERVAK